MKTHTHLTHRARRQVLRTAGFSLVEVTLALGVASFALLTMAGTMVVGLGSVKEASDDTMHAQIMARLASTVQQTPFDQLAAAALGREYYFDREGKEVAAHRSAYTATMSFSGGGPETYPGAPADLSPSVSTVTIRVITRSSGHAERYGTSYSSVIIPRS
jgi:uncharacterized protein (TIGR02598 family)